MGFFNRDGTKSLNGSFCGALWEVVGLPSGGRSGRESLESLNDSKSAKFFYKKIFGKIIIGQYIVPTAQ